MAQTKPQVSGDVRTHPSFSFILLFLIILWDLVTCSPTD